MGNNLTSAENTAQALIRRLRGLSLEAKKYKAILAALQEREDDRQAAYGERNKLVAFLSRLYPSHLALHPATDWAWDREWRTIVCIHAVKPAATPKDGIQTWSSSAPPLDESLQMTFHIHDSDVPLFAHLEMREGDWDGHDTPTKYERLRRLP